MPEVGEQEVALFGHTFRMADKVGQMPVLRFAKIASRGADTDTMAGFAAMYDLLKACIHPEDWDRFEQVADAEAADGEDLFDLVGQVLSRQADRPTSRPSDSSDGPSTTAPSSTSTPASRAIAREAGRPDVQMWLVRAQQEQAATA